jgi:conjugative transposon TraN protein
MKQLVSLISGCLAFVFSTAQTVCITTGKTTSLIFPYTILHVDRGTKDVLVLPVKESDHILLVKAAVKDFMSTNLSVVTSDGSVYSFPIQYAEEPALWIYQVPPQKNESIETYSNGIIDNPRTVRGIRDRSWYVESRITGIYINGNIIFYQLEINNLSPIDYDIDFLRFYIRDKKKGKRTAVQENELKPIYVAGNATQIKANQINVMVIALEKFTIPDAKYLAIEINERNGGRNLFLKVNNNKIVKAIKLPDLK